MSQPDYTFEQFADHLDPTDKLLKRSFEIIIKETARQALAKKRDPHYDPATSSSRPSLDPAASLRSAIASSQHDRAAASDRVPDTATLARLMARMLNAESNPRSSNARTATFDHTYQFLRSLRTSHRPSEDHADARTQSVSPFTPSSRTVRRNLRDFILTPTDGQRGSNQDSLASTQEVPSQNTTSSAPRITQSSNVRSPMPSRNARSPREALPSTAFPHNQASQLAQRRHLPGSSSTVGLSPQAISERLAEASRRNAEADRTIGDAERLRANQLIRESIESLRASLFQLHIELACTQVQQAHRERTLQSQDRDTTSHLETGTSYALLMDTIELFDDILRRLSCLVSGADTNRDSDPASVPATRTPSAQPNHGPSQTQTSLWRTRNLLLLSSLNRRANRNDANADNGTGTSSIPEIRAHRHLIATIEESRWSRPDAQPPSAETIRDWRRKLAAWYHLDRDPSQYPDSPPQRTEREEIHARWHPDLELPYSLDEILAPMASDPTSARPDPIADPQAAWAYARRHDTSLPSDLNQDMDVRAALQATPVVAALQQLLRLREERQGPIASTATPEASPLSDVGLGVASHGAGNAQRADAIANDPDPDVSLTRATSLSRRNAVRRHALTTSDSSSIRSAGSSMSLRREHDSSGMATEPVLDPQARLDATPDDNDSLEQGVENGIENGNAPRSPETRNRIQSSQPRSEGATEGPALLPPADRPRTGRSGSFTFISTPAAVLRSRQRSQSRSQSGPHSQFPAAVASDDDDDSAPDEDDAEAEEYIDLDLDLGMADEDAFDFDLVDFLRSESRRATHQRHDEYGELTLAGDGPSSAHRGNISRRDDSVDSESEESVNDLDDASRSGIRVIVSGSGASTPAEARQATFEAYAQRARLLERRRRMDWRRQAQDEADESEGARDEGNASSQASSESRRRRRGRNIGDTSVEAGDSLVRRSSLPFPRTSER